MKIFIAGVMQGNKKEHGLHPQDYRERIAKHIKSVAHDVDVIDPDKTDPDRLSYDDKQAAEMFFRYCDIAGRVDLLISYIPEASMGSAVEMWMAHKSGIPVITISPLNHNWVVRLLSKKVYSDLEAFEREFDRKLLEKLELF